MRLPKYINGVPWWEVVDWSKTDYQIASEVGLSKTVVWNRRHKLNIPPTSNTGGARKGVPKSPSHRASLLGKQNRLVTDWDYEFVCKNNPNKPTKSWRLAIKRVFGEACELCNYYRPPISNHAHHIIPKSEGGLHTIRNGCVLCSRCHDEIHAGLLSLSAEIVNRSKK